MKRKMLPVSWLCTENQDWVPSGRPTRKTNGFPPINMHKVQKIRTGHHLPTSVLSTVMTVCSSAVQTSETVEEIIEASGGISKLKTND